MTTKTDAPHKSIRHPMRWIGLGLLILSSLVAAFVPIVRPNIQAAPERLTVQPLFSLPVLGEVYLTNTLVMLVVVDLVMLGAAWLVNRGLRREGLAAKGVGGILIFALNAMYGFTENVAGKWTKKVFPWFATLTMLILFANWIELIPGVDSIGILRQSAEGTPVQVLIPGVLATVTTAGGSGSFELFPFLRGPSTDINFTLGLALVAMTVTQIVGLRVRGFGYLKKFFNVSQIFKKPFLGVMDFLVGLLELVGEISKVISFTFRLFGSIFAGMVLVVLTGALVPVLGQSLMLIFEFAMGMIQALVFGMLTIIFMTQAMGEGHDEKTDEAPETPDGTKNALDPATMASQAERS